MTPRECCVLIPSLSPDERLPVYVKELIAAGYGLVLVVDDGSKPEYQEIFERIGAWDGCKVLHHEVNRGKGAALKTGFSYLEGTEIRGIITADADGQHTVPDTLKLTKELNETQKLLLGSRDFSLKSKQVPIKSRLGNRITSLVFRVLYGQWLPDTQTGLRAFPSALLPFMQTIAGDRFEYEMNQLIHCAGHHYPMRAVNIETVYLDENKSSHFHAFRDSWRIYKLLLGNFFKYMSASFIATLLDLLIFTVLNRWVLPAVFPGWSAVSFLGSTLTVLTATAVARVISATFNYKVNKNFVFQLGSSKGAAWRYLLLSVCVMAVSGLVVGNLVKLLPGTANTLIKVIVDTVLFFVNYRIQKSWVFPEKE